VNATSQEEDQQTIALVNRIRDQKNKKRRGKFNKNEALYDFIEKMHRLNEPDASSNNGSQNNNCDSGRQYYSPPRYQQPAYQPASQLRTEMGYYN